ncbi:hypothetical protein SAMN04487885_12331 [Clostridium cadaveris]|uniref:Uncharacterized protein n=1 Tax=Clostridium cadaveris TaxID=1529 RepID=A0A1I2NRZ0_9CLOT|nr:hypothetical protein [Clostridium cadaveris]MDM8313540.1 iduronate sulfatase [Clostridium cadaveris]SFG05509.1 hypothetical protein SAMN04487885_12331 [Clostridium cadaveris]
MNDITTLFNTFVFPVALCILLIWFMYKKVWPRIEITLDRVTKTNQELSESNRILSQNMNEKITDLDKKVDLILKNGGI